MKLIDRIKGLFLTPDVEWRRIAHEDDSPSVLLLNYVAVLAAVPALADFIGMTLIGFTLPGGTTARVDVMSAFFASFVSYMLAFGVVAVLAAIILAAAPFFGAGRDLNAAFKLAVYAMTPAWLAGIFLLVPGLHFLIMLGLYGLYLLFKGMQVLLRISAEKAFMFAGAVTITSVVIALIAGALRAKIFSLPGIL